MPPPNSSGPLVGELEHCLFATVEAETAIVWSGVARRAEDSRPYRVVAVVHDYDLDPICREDGNEQDEEEEGMQGSWHLL